MNDPIAKLVSRPAGAWLAAALCLAASHACADPAAEQARYNALYPEYAEVCTLTQLNRKDAPPGGFGGHGVLYLNGACRDESAAYPRLRPCGPETDLSEPDSGVGISVNKTFANVNWVAIPGRNEFFAGGLAPRERLTEDYYDSSVRRAAESGWFRGVRPHEQFLEEKPAEQDLETFVIERSIGTDFAVTFGRTVYCARLPMPRPALTAVIDYLNWLNDRASTEGYHWNLHTNNCSHVIHNALAAAGVFDHKAVRGSSRLDVALNFLGSVKVVAGQMSDLAFPANGFVRAAEAGDERPLTDVWRAYQNRDVRATLGGFGWISTAPGALIVTYPMHPVEANDKFEPGRNPFIFGVPVIWPKHEKFDSLISSPPLYRTDLKANLEEFQTRYRAALASRKPLSALLRRHGIFGAGERARFSKFYHRFFDIIGAQAKEVKAKLSLFPDR